MAYNEIPQPPFQLAHASMGISKNHNFHPCEFLGYQIFTHKRIHIENLFNSTKNRHSLRHQVMYAQQARSCQGGQDFADELPSRAPGVGHVTQVWI